MCADNVESNGSTSFSSTSTDISHFDSNSEDVQLVNGRIPDFKSKGIKFGHINVNSLSSKIDEFRHMCTNIFDVIGINETKCDETVNDSEIVLPGYDLLRCDRSRNGGGVALYIKNGLDFKRRDDLCDQNVECIWIELTLPNKRPIFVCAVYNPNGKDSEFSNKLLCMLSNVPICDNEMVLLGDFNCDFSPHINTREVNSLKFVCDLHQLQQQITLPTRVTDHSSTLIDLYFTTKPELYDDCGVIQTAISDHFMIYAIRKGKPVKGAHKTIKFRSYKNFDEKSFLDDLFNVPWINVMKCDNVDDALQLWQCMFNGVINKHIPKKIKRVRAAPSPWLNNDIFKHMSKRDYLHRKAIRSNDTSDWNAYKLYRNKVTTMIRKSKETYFKVAINDCFGDSGKLWKTLKDVLPKKTSVNPSCLNVNGKILESEDDISNGFNKHFVDVALNLIESNGCGSDGVCNFNLDSCNHDASVISSEMSLPRVSCDFVDNEIRNMSTGKATGLDDVGVRILKIARPAIVESLTYIMNMSLQTGVFPNEWKLQR